MDRFMDHLAEEERLIREVVARHALPKHIKNFIIEFGEDWSGDPSVTLALIVDDDEALSADLTAVNAFVRTLLDELLELRLPHWPFVQLRADDAAPNPALQ